MDSSRANSRSPSPTGRISPFRGRGFNPSGSRFASPNPTPPPPEDARLTPTNLSPQHVSKIPKLKRKGSSAAFGDRISHHDSSPTKRKLESQLSQSLTNLGPKKTASKPPTSPRKNVHSKAPAFQKLSPIAGSSPEPSQSLSSPSRIPKSRSTPPSRRTSPTRTSSSLPHKPPPAKPSSRTTSRIQSRSQSRSQSRNTSREASPTKDPTSPTRIPVKYRNVQAKINTYNKTKPKVPPKPQVLSEQSEESDIVKDIKNKPSLSKKESVNKLRTNSRSNLIQKTENKSNNINNNVTSDSSVNVTSKIGNKITNKTNNINKSSNSTTNKIGKEKEEESKIQHSPKKGDNRQSPKKDNHKNSQEEPNETEKLTQRSSPIKSNVKKDYKNNDVTSDTDTSYDIKETANSGSEEKQLKRSESSVKLADILPSKTTVVSSTTSTVTQPLKIDANINATKADRTKQVSPMVDGRVLSATSVSNAMNRMNDTVLNTQTVIKEHGFLRLSPATNAIISAASETGKGSSATIDSITISKMELNEISKDSTAKYNKASDAEHKITNTDSTKANDADPSKEGGSDHNKLTNSNNSTTPNADISKAISAEINKVTNSEQNKLSNLALDTKSAITALPRVEPVTKKPENKIITEIKANERGNNHTNHLTHAGIISAKALETEVQKNMGRLISPEHLSGNSIQKSVNDRMKEARTVVAADVKPIRITVKEKPSDVEVQSGNVRPPVSVSNGFNERPR